MKILIAVLAGAGVGFLIGYLGRCRSGVCPLTSNPWISMLIGGAFAFLLIYKK